MSQKIDMCAPTVQERSAPPCAIVIFGASGDLTTRKLLPALYNLALSGRLSERTYIVGFARHQQTEENLRATIHKGIASFSRTRTLDEEVWKSLSSRLFYQAGHYDDAESFVQLQQRLTEIDQKYGTQGRHLFYVATPPTVFADIVRNLGAAGLAQSEEPESWARIVIEKPFGHDYHSAQVLNQQIQEVFSENQIFRIDHYLGKETVQNILAFRFANRLWEPVWSSQHIDHVQITVAESIGIENRASYYEGAGALRDVVQNHMLQVMALVAMEPPVTFEAESVRDEKVKVLKALYPFGRRSLEHDAARGQYRTGSVGGETVEGYRREPQVDPQSQTETYAALRLGIDNWRWAGTPFYLRHGKRLPARVSEVAVQFKRPPHLPFTAAGTQKLEPDLLLLRIQPEEGIVLRFGAKQPGPAMQLRSVDMEFTYENSFLEESLDAYERLILDCALGERTLFTRADEVELSWKFVDPLLTAWSAGDADVPTYAAGSWGPHAATELLARDGRKWHTP